MYSFQVELLITGSWRSQNTRLGCTVWWSLTFPRLRLSRTLPVYSITGQYILSLTDMFAVTSWNCVITKVCYKQDSQLFTKYALSVWNNLSMKSADSANLKDETNCSTSRRLFSCKMNLSTNLNFFKMSTLERWHAFVFKFSWPWLLPIHHSSCFGLR